MLSASPFELCLQDLCQLLLFLREVKRTYKDLSSHSEAYASKCIKTVERAKLLPKSEHQSLQSALLSYVKAAANAASAQSGQFAGLHGGLKNLVAVVKDTKKAMESGAKSCAERVKSAKKAWDKAECSKSQEQSVWSSSDPMATLKATQMRNEVAVGLEAAERGKQNYLAVVRESDHLQAGYIQCVQELKSKSLQTVSQALSDLLSRSHSSLTRPRTPLLMLKGQNSFSGCGQWDESHGGSPKFSDISSISRKSQSSTGSPRRDGNLWKLHEFLLTSDSSKHAS